VKVLWVRAAEQPAGRGEVERDVALQLQRADEEVAGGDEDRAAAVAVAGFDRGLDRGGVEGLAVAGGAEVANVVDAGAEELLIRRSGGGRGGGRTAGEGGADERRGCERAPLAPRETIVAAGAVLVHFASPSE
jgi:hypothetical protein